MYPCTILCLKWKTWIYLVFYVRSRVANVAVNREANRFYYHSWKVTAPWFKSCVLCYSWSENVYSGKLVLISRLPFMGMNGLWWRPMPQIHPSVGNVPIWGAAGRVAKMNKIKKKYFLISMYPKWKMDPPKKVNFSKISKFWATLTQCLLIIINLWQ